MNCHSVSKVCQKSKTLHISLLNVNQPLKNPNLKLGLKLKMSPFKVGLFLPFFQLSNAHISPGWGFPVTSA